MDKIELKMCSKCFVEKPTSYFFLVSRKESRYRSRCKECLAEDRRSKKETYRKAGLCLNCGKPRDTTTDFCNLCSKKSGKRYKLWRDLMREQGLCTQCGLPAENGKSRCSHCLEIHRAHSAKKRLEFSKKVGNYFDNICAICGVKSFDYEIYDLHHIDPSVKKCNVTSMKLMTWGKALPELDKCTYLCAVCHRRLHAGRFDEAFKTNQLVLIPGKLLKGVAA